MPFILNLLHMHDIIIILLSRAVEVKYRQIHKNCVYISAIGLLLIIIIFIQSQMKFPEFELGKNSEWCQNKAFLVPWWIN